MSTTSRSVVFSLFLSACLLVRAVPANAQQAVETDPCASQSSTKIAATYGLASTVAQAKLKTSVLPGGTMTSIEIPAVMPVKSYYCARFVENDETVKVVSASTEGGQKTTLTIEVPKIRFGPQVKRKFVLAAYPLDENGKLNLDSPILSVIQEVWVSNGLFATVIAVVAVIIAYLIAVLSQGKIKRAYSFNPVYLTSGFDDRASLSQFQIFCFTLLVFGLLIFVLMRTSVLSDISSDILLLLGISAGGTAGSKVAGIMKKRLSSESDSWFRNHGWLTAYQAGIGMPADPKRARWGDLLKTGEGFDIYSFQLATFSFLVGVALLKSDLSTLATFTLPPNLLGILGLSNVVYIGGKAVTPSLVGELDEKVQALRKAETDWLAQAIPTVIPLPDQQAKLQAAIKAAPQQYQTFISTAREAARMLKTIYGGEGTKFKDELIDDNALMPVFP